MLILNAFILKKKELLLREREREREREKRERKKRERKRGRELVSGGKKVQRTTMPWNVSLKR